MIRGSWKWNAWVRDITAWLELNSKVFEEQCPHCGYYCTGKTVFCTKGTEKDG